MGWCPDFKSLWPQPALGAGVVRDVYNPPTFPTSPVMSQSVRKAARGSVFQGEYTSQNYVVGMDHIMIPSLAKQMVYNWDDAVYKVGGPHYPDNRQNPPGTMGFGPGFQGDCMSPQFYMRPGIRMPVSQGGRQM